MMSSSCKLDSDGSVSLQDILSSFNASIKEEHAWALCYQCVRMFIEYLNDSSRGPCCQVDNVGQVYLQSDGNVHPKTIFANAEHRQPIGSQVDLVNGLGSIIFLALDHGVQGGEERVLNQNLEELMSEMLYEQPSAVHETDDEGIVKDADEHLTNVTHITLQQVAQRCERHLMPLSKAQAESHYRNVVRALVAEALELATFLHTIAQGNLRCESTANKRDLEKLQFADWARFWMQVIAQLRQGVKLKKVHPSRAPVEYELTPYEILMKDIRACRYNLRKIMVNGDVPRVTKDAHAIILEFIRSRPPLKKASDRKLPPRTHTVTRHEQLMSSIRKGRKLRNVRSSLSPSKLRSADVERDMYLNSPRRVIHIDYSQIDADDDSDSSDDVAHSRNNNLEAYDLALDCAVRTQGRRHTLGVCMQDLGSQSVPQSRPASRQSCASSDTESVQLPPAIEKALHDSTKPWDEVMSLDDRLSLTLEEIVHIRTVMTKAELEALPAEGHVRGDVENRKVCFLCLKTRFGILGPWGQRCSLCKRTVCSKCCSKMNIPMEHYSNVPVVLLSPSITATPEDEYYSSAFSSRSSTDHSPSSSRPGSALDRFRTKASAVGKTSVSVNRLKGSLMLVCHDCKMMVREIIKSAQANRSAIRNKHLQSLTLNLSPVFM